MLRKESTPEWGRMLGMGEDKKLRHTQFCVAAPQGKTQLTELVLATCTILVVLGLPVPFFLSLLWYEGCKWWLWRSCYHLMKSNQEPQDGTRGLIVNFPAYTPGETQHKAISLPSLIACSLAFLLLPHLLFFSFLCLPRTRTQRYSPHGPSLSLSKTSF